MTLPHLVVFASKHRFATCKSTFRNMLLLRPSSCHSATHIPISARISQLALAKWRWQRLALLPEPMHAGNTDGAHRRRERVRKGEGESMGTDAHNRCLPQFPYCSNTLLGTLSNPQQKEQLFCIYVES